MQIFLSRMSTVKDQTKKEQKSTGLKKCFTALVDRKQVNLDTDVLILILKKELLINMDALDANLVEVLPIMLVMYMKSWPGWQRSKEYFSGKLNFKEWYEKFRQYIVVRLNYLVKNGYSSVIEEIKREKKGIDSPHSKKTFVEHSTQTDALAPKSFAPFNICITAPASAVNSMIFDDLGDDIIVKQSHDIPWVNITTKQLIHWPNVEIEFFMPELSFKRKNCFEYTRYINFSNTPLVYNKPEYIDQVEIIDPSSGRNCYSYNLLRCYVKEYISILKSVSEIDSDLARIVVMLNEFLMDIIEINMNNSMATNTSVIFNIGRGAFIRSKKASKSAFNSGFNTSLRYFEIIIPKVETSLNFFKGVQDLDTTEVTFSYLNMIKNSLKTNDPKSTINLIMPLIVYKCSYCQVSFKNESEIMNHIEQIHKMDPNVQCIKCKRSLSLNNLTNTRWHHVCSANPVSLQHNIQGPITIN